MCEFEKNKRAIYLTERNFLHRKKFFEEDLQEDVFSIKTPQWILDDPDYGQRRYHRGLSWNQISTAMRYCQLLYSAGLPMPEVVSATHDMLERFHKHFDIDFPEDKLQLWEADSYAYILWLLGLAVLSNHKESLNRIPGWLSPDLDENGERILGGAPLVDAPMKALLDLVGYRGRVQVSPEPFFPKSVYMLIADIIHPPKNPDNPFESSEIIRGRLLRDYLKGWYKTNKDTYWYDYHKVRDGELFFGYWAFETAIFTLLLHADMEGQPLKAMSFYPKDYIEYARKHGFAVLDGI
mgnify:FL=1